MKDFFASGDDDDVGGTNKRIFHQMTIVRNYAKKAGLLVEGEGFLARVSPVTKRFGSLMLADITILKAVNKRLSLLAFS